MEAREELLEIKQRLLGRIDALQDELVIVDKSIQLIEREGKLESVRVQPLKNDSPGTQGEFATMGLTDSCQQLLDSADLRSPTEVRDLLIQGGYPKTDRKKLLASVYATLKRLRVAGKVERRKTSHGPKYRLKGSAMEPTEK